MSEFVAFLVWLFLRFPLPLGPITVLFIDLGTDMVPGIMFAYDAPERGIMNRPPRDAERDRLVSLKMINWVYPATGTVQGIGALIIYFIIMGDAGFWPQNIFWSSPIFESDTVNDFVDSYGQQWTFNQRMQLEYLTWSGFFFGIMQVAFIKI